MCCCEKPNVNGTPGYRWQPTDPPSIRPSHPPDLAEGDTLLFDEPGRCGGGLDGHCHHFRLVKDRYGHLELLVRHGGGDERIQLGCSADVAANHEVFSCLASDARYWLLHSMYSIHKTADRSARESVQQQWAAAFIGKRIKKQKRKGRVRVWIEAAVPQETVST